MDCKVKQTKSIEFDFDSYFKHIFYESPEQAVISIMNIFDSIKDKIGFNRIAYSDEIKMLVERIIISALLIPYELSADYIKNGNNHLKSLIEDLNLLIKYPR